MLTKFRNAGPGPGWAVLAVCCTAQGLGGAVLAPATLSVTVLVYGIISAQTRGWGSPVTVAALAAAAPCSPSSW